MHDIYSQKQSQFLEYRRKRYEGWEPGAMKFLKVVSHPQVYWSRDQWTQLSESQPPARIANGKLLQSK